MSPSQQTPVVVSSSPRLHRSNAVPGTDNKNNSLRRRRGASYTVQHLQKGRLSPILEEETLQCVATIKARRVNQGVRHPPGCIAQTEFVAVSSPEQPHRSQHQHQHRRVETRFTSATHHRNHDTPSGPRREQQRHQNHPQFPHPDPRRRRIETSLPILDLAFPTSQPTQHPSSSSQPPNPEDAAAVSSDIETLNATQAQETADFLERLATWVPGKTCLNLPVLHYGATDVGREAWWRHGEEQRPGRNPVGEVGGRGEGWLGWDFSLRTGESERVRREREMWAGVDVGVVVGTTKMEMEVQTVQPEARWWKRVSWSCGLRRGRA